MGSFGKPIKAGSSGLVETSCGYLLEELQMIWDEVGEDQPEREKILLELEQECLEVYRRKVDRANILRAQLHQELAVSEADLTHLLLLLGERSLPGRPERMTGTLKEQLQSITPALKEMQLRKEERVKQFRAVQGQIQKILNGFVQLHQLGKDLMNLWDLMDTPYADRQHFSHVTIILSLSCAEISDPGSLTVNIIQQAETEVKRLDQLKASKMKELFLRKQMELEDICNKSHMEIPSTSEMEKILDLINSGDIDHADLLASMDDHISKAQEEALSRKVIMEKIEKWISARNEERWLEEYSRDENRYSVHRGSHKNLRRAERARLMVHKIPALVDLLIAKTKTWEEERKKVFLYDEAPLMEILEEYNELRKLKEDEKQRQRDMKKVQIQMELGQGNLLVNRPGTSSRRLSDMNQTGGYTNTSTLNHGFTAARVTLGSQQLGSLWNSSPTHEKTLIKAGKKEHAQKFYRRNGFPRHIKDDAVSVVSSFSGPMSP